MPQSRKEKVNILPPICSQTESRLIMHPLLLPSPIHKPSDRFKKKKRILIWVPKRKHSDADT